MNQKIPEILKAIELLNYLKSKNNENISTDYLITDGIYMKANINKGLEKVGLWLGADVMVEYNFEEAEKLLNDNLKNAENNLAEYDNDLDYLREQITTIEVNSSRVYNYKVQSNKEKPENK